MSEKLEQLNEKLKEMSEEHSTANSFNVRNKKEEKDHLKTIWRISEKDGKYSLQNLVYIADSALVRSVSVAKGKTPEGVLSEFKNKLAYSEDEDFSYTYNTDLTAPVFFEKVSKFIEEEKLSSVPASKTKNKM